MWKCPECETLNDGVSCVICGWERPKPMATAPKADTNGGLQRPARMTVPPNPATYSTPKPTPTPTPNPTPNPYSGGATPTPNPYSSGASVPPQGTTYSGASVGYTDKVYTAPPAYSAPPYSAVPPRTVSRNECFTTYISNKLRVGVRTNIIIAYVCVILSMVVSVGLYAADIYPVESLIGAVAEILLMFGYVIGVHTTKSKVCAVGLVAITATDSIFSIISSGKATGWLFLAAAISLLKVITDGEKEYKAFVTEKLRMPYKKNGNAIGIIIVIAIAAALLLFALAA